MIRVIEEFKQNRYSKESSSEFIYSMKDGNPNSSEFLAAESIHEQL